jgi:lipopolysaccharide transport system ATP-binding protein
MSLPAIEVSGLSKRYIIEHESRHDSLRDTLHHKARQLWRRYRWGTRFEREEFWALRDVSFAVQPGEVVGIVGRNGAGKSTLLKILSRITEPTAGKITLRGRVASLLEVGTGFHPDLTGRENIYLNGAILGMQRAEIRRKFDEIVAFAEIERFLDTPVKRYSSGMYVRLAFAVAAHLEPEILIVDEVLAVGDMAFQKKCLGKMQSVAQGEGRTVLFVSHNIHAVRQLCRTGVLLGEGRLKAHGPVAKVLDAYLDSASGVDSKVPAPAPELRERAYVTDVRFEDLQGRPNTIFSVGQGWRAKVRIHLARPYPQFVTGFGLVSTDGVGVQTAWMPPVDLAPGDYEITFEQTVSLQATGYTAVVGLSSGDLSIQQVPTGRIDISGEDPHGFFPLTSGFGIVLNSMKTSLIKL